jgi:multicomponent Na+:H+ antiporter subunit F
MWISSFIALAAVIIAGLRFILGPTAADRTMALDILTVISISLIALIALSAGRAIYFDVAFVYGLLSFIGVVAVARYLEGGL